MGTRTAAGVAGLRSARPDRGLRRRHRWTRCQWWVDCRWGWGAGRGRAAGGGRAAAGGRVAGRGWVAAARRVGAVVARTLAHGRTRGPAGARCRYRERSARDRGRPLAPAASRGADTDRPRTGWSRRNPGPDGPGCNPAPDRRSRRGPPDLARPRALRSGPAWTGRRRGGRGRGRARWPAGCWSVAGRVRR